ncbi:hypothetical protein GG344DRAFT_80203 [Lentinula edodes]|nr:hypothetical protein GG344DRAFT_80203 [Lentinula edodes]
MSDPIHRRVLFSIILLSTLLCMCPTTCAAPAFHSSLAKHAKRRIRGKWMRMIMENVTEQDEQLFSSPLSSIILDHRLPESGSNSVSAYTLKGTYKGHNGKDLVVKILPHNSTYTWGEAKALKAVGDLVDSGTILYTNPLRGGSPKYLPAVIMKKKSGQILEHLPGYQGAKPADKKKLRTSIVTLLCAKVAEVAATKRVVHRENHKRNILISLKDDKSLTVSSIELVDYGWPGTFFVYENVDATDVKSQAFEDCKEAWRDHWIQDKWEVLRNDEFEDPEEVSYFYFPSL